MERESNTDKIIRLYGNLNPDELSDISLPSEIDESSGDEREKIKERAKKRDKVLKEKLLKQMRHQLITCQGPCRQSRTIRSFNPQLRKYGTGPTITWRKWCNSCRKRK